MYNIVHSCALSVQRYNTMRLCRVVITNYIVEVQHSAEMVVLEVVGRGIAG